MSDTTLNRFMGRGTSAQRAAFTPSAPTPSSGPSQAYIWWDTDVQAAYAYDFGLAAWVLTTAMVKIAEATPSATGTVTFASLGTFTHLEIRWSARSDLAANVEESLLVQFNADTGANYDTEILYNNGATTSAAFEQLAATSGIIGIMPAATATASKGMSGTIWIPDYRGTTFHKSASSVTGGARGTATGTIYVRTCGVAWRNAAAITAVALKVTGNYIAGSKFTLYGLL